MRKAIEPGEYITGVQKPACPGDECEKEEQITSQMVVPKKNRSGKGGQKHNEFLVARKERSEDKAGTEKWQAPLRLDDPGKKQGEQCAGQQDWQRPSLGNNRLAPDGPAQSKGQSPYEATDRPDQALITRMRATATHPAVHRPRCQLQRG